MFFSVTTTTLIVYYIRMGFYSLELYITLYLLSRIGDERLCNRYPESDSTSFALFSHSANIRITRVFDLSTGGRETLYSGFQSTDGFGIGLRRVAEAEDGWLHLSTGYI